MKLIRNAIKFAAEKHKGQERKTSELPYVVHPLEVAFIISKYKSSKRLDELMVAAILHDTLEDTETNFIEISTEFTPLVASLVLELTSDIDEIKRVGKNEYLKNKLVGLSNYALLLKLADRLANISDTPKDSYKEDTRELIEHIELKRILTKSQLAIIKEIRNELNMSFNL